MTMPPSAMRGVVPHNPAGAGNLRGGVTSGSEATRRRSRRARGAGPRPACPVASAASAHAVPTLGLPPTTVLPHPRPPPRRVARDEERVPCIFTRCAASEICIQHPAATADGAHRPPGGSRELPRLTAPVVRGLGDRERADACPRRGGAAAIRGGAAGRALVDPLGRGGHSGQQPTGAAWASTCAPRWCERWAQAAPGAWVFADAAGATTRRRIVRVMGVTARVPQRAIPVKRPRADSGTNDVKGCRGEAKPEGSAGRLDRRRHRPGSSRASPLGRHAAPLGEKEARSSFVC